MKAVTSISDARDTGKKVSLARELAEKDAAFAVLAVRKIIENPALLNGLAKVVSQLAKHEEAGKLLENLFENKKWVVKAYPTVYQAYLKARFFGR